MNAHQLFTHQALDAKFEAQPQLYYTPNLFAPSQDTTPSFDEYERHAPVISNSYTLEHSTTTSPANTPCLQSSSVSSSPLLQTSETPTVSNASLDKADSSDSDSFFIPVQGVLPPTKNEDGRFACQLCDRSYTHAKHLKRHMMRHTGQKPYSCSWCSARFTRPDIRKRHVSKCKVRRKMEGLDCIKIEEEDPAKMISIKNQKMNERRAKKLAAAKAAEKKTELEQKELPKPERKETSPATSTFVPGTPLLSVEPTGVEDLTSSSVDCASPLLESNDANEILYNTPDLAGQELYAHTPQPFQAFPETVYYGAMPTPSVAPSSVAGYMTPTSPASFPTIGMKPTDVMPGALDHPHQNMCYYVNISPSPMPMYYPTAQGHQPIMLTPQHFNMAPPHNFFHNNGCVYPEFESPLETFVPPMFN